MSAELRTRTWWGFHELTERWARRLVDGAAIHRGDLVLDIGAGRGAITAPLLDAGARVIAFELHPGRAASLRERFAGTNVVVVRADASDLRLPRRPFHVVANPPFAIATSLMRRLTSRHSQLVSAALVLPDHAAARWSRELPSRFGASTAALPSQAFRPRPPGRVAVLHIVCR